MKKQDDVSSVPKYVQLAERFRMQMRDGTLKSGERLPSFAEVRKEFGIGQATMERVHALLEKEGLITREPGRGTFVKAPGARERKQTGLIGFVGALFTGRHSSLWSYYLAEGVQEAMLSADRRLLHLEQDSALGWDQIDGLLIGNVAAISKAMSRLPVGIPCVSLLESAPGVASVLTDEYGGAKSAVRHLLKLGHTRIACLTQTKPRIARERLRGYRDALEEGGIKPRDEWIQSSDNGPPDQIDYLEDSNRAMRSWLEKGWWESGCTALFAQNDSTACGAIKALQQAGVRVPGEVSVVGFDSTEMCEYVSPRITAVRVPLREVGRAAVEILMRQISSDTAPEFRDAITVLPTHLEIRDSTAPPPAG